MHPSQMIAQSRQSRLAGPFGVADSQWRVAYGVAGFGGSMLLSRTLASQARLSRPTAVAVPVVASTVIALAFGLSHESSLELIVGSLIGSTLGVIL